MKKVRKKKLLYDDELFNLFKEAFPEAKEEFHLEAVHEALVIRLRFRNSFSDIFETNDIEND